MVSEVQHAAEQPQWLKVQEHETELQSAHKHVSYMKETGQAEVISPATWIQRSPKGVLILKRPEIKINMTHDALNCVMKNEKEGK